MVNTNKYINRVLLPIIAVCFCISTVSCRDDEEVYDNPFIHINANGGLSWVIVSSDVNNVNSYNIYLSSGSLTQNVVVNYEIVVGNGLQAGRDFELVNPGNTITFLPGIYSMPVRIRWKPNRVDPTKNNTLTIRLTGNNMDFNLGLPGPDALQRELVIEKRNM